MRPQALEVTAGRERDAAVRAAASSGLMRGKRGKTGHRHRGQNVGVSPLLQMPQFGENDPSSEFPRPGPPPRRFVGEFRDGSLRFRKTSEA
jgi:hypothetical protein